MTIQLNGKTPTKIVRWHNGAEQAVKKIVIFPDGVTEKQIRPAGWKPGANTLIYLPLKNTTDETGNYTMFNYNTTFNSNYAIFNGSSDLATTTNFALSGKPTCTVNFWTKYTSGVVLWGFGTASGCLGMLVTSSTLKIWNYVHDINTGLVMPVNTWTNLVLTYDGTTIKVYKDGNTTPVYSATYNYSAASGLLALGANTFHRSPSEPVDGYTGYISEFIIEDKARTAQEISSYYNQTKGNYGL